jgi:hypothetical protein
LVVKYEKSGSFFKEEVKKACFMAMKGLKGNLMDISYLLPSIFCLFTEWNIEDN